jgi:hypothetical protein
MLLLFHDECAVCGHSRLRNFRLASRQLQLPIPVNAIVTRSRVRTITTTLETQMWGTPSDYERAHFFLVLANFSCHLRADGFMDATALSPLIAAAALPFALMVVSEGNS